MEATMKKSMNDLMSTFMERMDSFEDKLVKTPNPSPSRDSLAEEFAAFKTFILSSLKVLQEQIECLANSVDQLEMRTRRKILLLHGVAEETSEDTSGVVAQTVAQRSKQAAFTVGDISRCHRMGRTQGNTDKPRPILCKFRDVCVRDKIWAAKVGLKGSGISISEFLTKPRHDIFMAARQRFGVSKCWTREGSVYVLGTDGVRHRISCLGDVDALEKPKQKAPKPAVVVKEPAPSKTRKAASKK